MEFSALALLRPVIGMWSWVQVRIGLARDHDVDVFRKLTRACGNVKATSFIARIIPLLIVVSIFSSCTRWIPPRPPASCLTNQSDEKRRLLATENQRAQGVYSKYEARLFKADHKALRRCMALSGGGIRAAAFAIGILKGYASELPKFDIVSAVSGGSYALSWYYARHYNAQYNRLSHFEDSSINELAGKMNFLRINEWGKIAADSFPFVNRRCAIDTGSTIPYLGIHQYWIPIIYAGCRAMPLLQATTVGPSTLAGKDYADRIADVFGLGYVELSSLARHIEDEKLPLFIVSASICRSDDNVPLSSTIIEFTPVGIATTRSGKPIYVPYDQLPYRELNVGYWGEYRLRSLPAISGAVHQKFLSMFTDLELSYIAPPLSRFDSDEGDFLLLIDGGYSDNLAMVPLIRRECEEIIVVDATEDSDYKFDDFLKLQCHLDTEMQVQLRVPEIDRILLRPRDGNFSAGECWSLAAENIEHPANAQFNAWQPIMKGEISNLSMLEPDSSIREVKIGITYIKLSFPEIALSGTNEIERAMRCYGKKSVDLYQKLKDDEPERSKQFPHFKTSKLNWEASEFEALVDLGFNIATKFNGELSQCN